MFVVRVVMFAAVAVLSSCSNLDANFYVPPQVTNPVIKLNRDFNGDHNSDFIVGSEKLGHLFFGAAGLSSLDDFRVTTTRSHSIYTLNALGDINRDGYGDYATASIQCNGRVDVYLGSPNNDGRPISIASPEVCNVEQSDQFFFIKGSESHLRFGAGVYPLGDVNGDNFADFAVLESKYYRVVEPIRQAAPGEPPPPAFRLHYGQVHVYHGNENGFEKAPYVIEANTSDPFLYFGSGGVTNGDFNSDGVSDIAVASYNFVSDASSENRVHIYYGQKKTETSPGGLNFITLQINEGEPAKFIKVAQPDVVVTHDESDDVESNFGNTIVSGDFNGDSYIDLAVGAEKDTQGCVEVSTGRCGAVYVFYGNSQGFGEVGTTISSDSATRLKFPGLSTNDAEFGGALEAIDLNSDGVDDLIVGAAEAIRNTGKGYVYLFRGNSEGIEPLHVNRWWAQLGSMETGEGGMRFDYSLSNVGDVNKDGREDLMIGSSNSTNDHGILVLGNSPENNSYQVLPFLQKNFQDTYFGKVVR